MDWPLQQWREVIGFDDTHRYLIHDRDSLFARQLDESIKALGVKVLKSPPHCPKANAICERVIGGWDRPLGLLVLGLLASGGAGFWNVILSYLLQAKNLKKSEVAKS